MTGTTVGGGERGASAEAAPASRRRHSSPRPRRLAGVQRVLRRVHMSWFDGLLAGGLVGAGLALLLLAGGPGYPLVGRQQPDELAYALLAVQVLPLILRRRFPLSVFFVILLATVAYQIADYPFSGGDLALAVAFYTVASRYGPLRTFQAAAAIAVPVIGLTLTGRMTIPVFVMLHVVFGTLWVLGDTGRRRGQRIAALEQRTESMRQEQQRRVRQAVADERVRIAQELHDLAAHALGVIAIQAQAATRTVDRRPDQARSSLAAIEGLADESLADLRRLLGFLRSDGDESSARRPQPTLDDIEPLADSFRRAGLPVEIIVEGRPRRLSAGMQTSAYRVIQEALTNTLKHAGRATVLVLLRYRMEALEVEVADTGRGPKEDIRVGQGLTGMRERVAMFGGDLAYGAGPHGGFVVSARLPMAGVDAA